MVNNSIGEPDEAARIHTRGPMKRKLQIFVSSTFTDLRAERQAAVEAILRAGHIPAGMELFSAGDKSQLETIYRWIDESDVYMLILGGRYGTVESDSGKSYTQLEYEHAVSSGKKFFSVVLTDTAIESKVKAEGTTAIERQNPLKLEKFREVVMSRICRLVSDEKDIKLAIHETLLEFLREYHFDGWVSAREMASAEDTAREVTRLANENAGLRAALARLHDVAGERGQSKPDLVLSRIYVKCSPDNGRGLLPIQWIAAGSGTTGTGPGLTSELLLPLSNIGTASAKDVVAKWSFPYSDAFVAIDEAAVGIESPPAFELHGIGMLEQKSKRFGQMAVTLQGEATFDYIMPTSSGTDRAGLPVPYAFRLVVAAFEYVKLYQVMVNKQQQTPVSAELPPLSVALTFRDINDKEYSTDYNVHFRFMGGTMSPESEGPERMLQVDGLLQPESVRREQLRPGGKI